MRGFTLIELLIVVAIIAALAAIAVPNFLEAQVRSKVSRVKSDLRTLSLGLEAYAVEHQRYPDAHPQPVKAGPQWSEAALSRLTTPVAFLTFSNVVDPFRVDRGDGHLYGYANWRAMGEPIAPGGPSTFSLALPFATPHQLNMLCDQMWMLGSGGPDKEIHGASPQGTVSVISGLTTREDLSLFYDPTNGTVSTGDIIRNLRGQLN